MNKAKEYCIRGIKSLLLPVLVYVLFALLSQGRFGKPATMLVILRQSVFPICLAWALMPNMTMGMWDFSAGAVVYGGAIIGANLAIATGTGIVGMIIFVIVISVAMASLTGLLYNLLRLPSLVLSIGLCMVYEAFVSFVGDQTHIPTEMMILSKAPWCFIIFALGFVIMYLAMNKTVFGNNVKAIGANQAVAVSTGMNIAKMKQLSFSLGGLFLGVAALLFVSQSGVLLSPASLGTLSPIFDAMMGVFIGTFLSRYCNMVIGVAIGAFTMKMLSVALIAVGLTSSVRDIITGLFLMVLLCISSNQGLIAHMKQQKQDAKQANLEYEAKAS